MNMTNIVSPNTKKTYNTDFVNGVDFYNCDHTDKHGCSMVLANMF